MTNQMPNKKHYTQEKLYWGLGIISLVVLMFWASMNQPGGNTLRTSLLDNTNSEPSYLCVTATQECISMDQFGCFTEPNSNMTVCNDPPPGTIYTNQAACLENCGVCTITVNSTADKTSGAAPLVVQFTGAYSFIGNCTGSPSYAWDKESDGIVDSTLQNPYFTYLNAGTSPITFQTKLTVIIGGVSKEKTITITVQPQPPNTNVNSDGGNCGPLSVSILGQPTVGNAPLNVNFNAQVATYPCTPDILEVSWDFGDGSLPSPNLVTTHLYQQGRATPYHVIFTARKGGQIVVQTMEVYVNGPGNGNGNGNQNLNLNINRNGNNNTNSSLALTSLNPDRGPVQTVVTVRGRGFSSSGNAIQFGYGYLPNISSTNNGTQLKFTVPSSLNPACRYNNPPCGLLTKQTTPGDYDVSVVHAGGAISNALNFTVTANGNGNGNNNGNGNGNGNRNTNTNGTNSFIPKNVVATANSHSSTIFIRWDPINTNLLEGYIVYRFNPELACVVAPCDQFEYIGKTFGAVTFIDTTAAKNVKYSYKITSLVSGTESKKSEASNEVTIGIDGAGTLSADFMLLPYSHEKPVDLSVTGLGPNITWSTYPAYSPNMLKVTPKTGHPEQATMTVDAKASPAGGVVYVVAKDAAGKYGTMVVIIWPRGDTDGNFLVGAVDQNNVAFGWTEK